MPELPVFESIYNEDSKNTQIRSPRSKNSYIILWERKPETAGLPL